MAWIELIPCEDKVIDIKAELQGRTRTNYSTLSRQVKALIRSYDPNDFTQAAQSGNRPRDIIIGPQFDPIPPKPDNAVIHSRISTKRRPRAPGSTARKLANKRKQRTVQAVVVREGEGSDDEEPPMDAGAAANVGGSDRVLGDGLQPDVEGVFPNDMDGGAAANVGGSDGVKVYEQGCQGPMLA